MAYCALSKIITYRQRLSAIGLCLFCWHTTKLAGVKGRAGYGLVVVDAYDQSERSRDLT